MEQRGLKRQPWLLFSSSLLRTDSVNQTGLAGGFGHICLVGRQNETIHDTRDRSHAHAVMRDGIYSVYVLYLLATRPAVTSTDSLWRLRILPNEQREMDVVPPLFASRLPIEYSQKEVWFLNQLFGMEERPKKKRLMLWL